MEKQKPKTKFEQLMQHRPVQIVTGLVAFAMAYVFASWAIDTGSLLDYAITILLICIGLRELALAIFKRKK